MINISESGWNNNMVGVQFFREVKTDGRPILEVSDPAQKTRVLFMCNATNTKRTIYPLKGMTEISI